MRPTVLVDCDGVLADFTHAALDGIFMVTGQCLDRSIVQTWEVFDSVPEDLHWSKDLVYDALRAEGACRAFRPLEGAKDGLARISEVADILVVTSPFRPSRTWVHERDEWLHEHFPFIGGVVHTKNKHFVHGDVFVDDKKRHVDSWRAHWDFYGHPGDTFTGIWWNNSTGLPEATRWAKLYDVVAETARAKRTPV